MTCVKRAARMAGFLYLVATVFMVFTGVLRSRLVLLDGFAATASNMEGQG